MSFPDMWNTYNFTRGDYTFNAEHNVLIFIEGIPLQFHVQELSISLSMLAENNCSITLKNPNDVFVITQANINGQFNRSGDPEVDEAFKLQLYQYKTTKNLEDPKTQTRRWELAHRKTVFDKHDVMMIWVKIPWTPASTHESYGEKHVWVPRFTGYISAVSLNSNAQNQSSEISLTGYCAKGVLKQMRVAQNPQIHIDAARSVGQITSSNIFVDPDQDIRLEGEQSAKAPSNLLLRDIASPSYGSFALYNTEPYNVVSYMITGKRTTKDSRESDKGYGDVTDRAKLTWSGDGSLTLSVRDGGEATAGTQDITNLQDFYYKCILGFNVRGSAETMQAYTLEEAIAIGENCTFDGTHSPHGALKAMIFVEPKEGIGYKASRAQEAQTDTITDGRIELDFTTRLEVINTLLGYIDYKFWVTPAGDFVFEYPKYDFYPEDLDDLKGDLVDYGADSFLNAVDAGVPSIDPNAQNDISEDKLNLNGSVRQLYIFDNLLINTSIEEQAEDVKTVFRFSGGYPGVSKDAQNAATEIGERLRGVIWLPALFYKYGINDQNWTFPEIIYDSNKLNVWAMIKVQQSLAMIYRVTASNIPFNPLILPNNPAYIRANDCHCLVSTVTDSIRPNAATTMCAFSTFRFRRTPYASVDAGNSFRYRGNREDYFLLTNTPSMPITYNTLLQGQDYRNFFRKLAGTTGNQFRGTSTLTTVSDSVLAKLPQGGSSREHPFLFSQDVPGPLKTPTVVTPLSEAEQTDIQNEVENTEYDQPEIVESIEAAKNAASGNFPSMETDFNNGNIVDDGIGILNQTDEQISNLSLGIGIVANMLNVYQAMQTRSHQNIVASMGDLINFAYNVQQNSTQDIDSTQSMELATQVMADIEQSNATINAFYSEQIASGNFNEDEIESLERFQASERVAAVQKALAKHMGSVDERYSPTATTKMMIAKAKQIDTIFGVPEGSLKWDTYSMLTNVDPITIAEVKERMPARTSDNGLWELKLLSEVEFAYKAKSQVGEGRKFKKFAENYLQTRISQKNKTELSVETESL